MLMGLYIFRRPYTRAERTEDVDLGLLNGAQLLSLEPPSCCAKGCAANSP